MAAAASLGFIVVFLAMACISVFIWSVGAILVPRVDWLRYGHRAVWTMSIGTLFLSALFIYYADWSRHLAKTFGWRRPFSDGAAFAPIAAHLLLLALLGSAAMLFSHSYWHTQVDLLRWEARARNFPTSLADYYQDVAPEKNAYPGLANFLENLTLNEHSGLTDLKLGLGRWEIADDKYVDAQLRLLKNKFPDFIDPYLKEKTHYVVNDYQAAANAPQLMKDGEFNGLMMLGNISFYLASSEATRGNESAAWKNVARCMTLAKLAASDPSLPAQMASFTIERRCVQASVNVLLRRPAAELPVDLKERLIAALRVRRVDLGLQFRFANFMDLQRREYHAESFTLDDYAPSPLFRMGWRVAVQAGAIDAGIFAAGRWLMDQMRLEGPQAPYNPVLSEWPFFLEKNRLRLNFQKFHITETEHKAWIRMTLIASALSAFQRREGVYPKALNELSPRYLFNRFLVDPLRTGGFVYKRTARGFELGSLGHSGDGRTSQKKPFRLTAIRH